MVKVPWYYGKSDTTYKKYHGATVFLLLLLLFFLFLFLDMVLL